MLELDPTDKQVMAFALLKAVKRSGLTSAEIRERLDRSYGVKLSSSALSHVIHRGTISLQRALQIFDVCGERELRIRPVRE